MTTALPTGTKSSAPPSIKLTNVGDEVKFAVVDIALDLPMTEFGSEPPRPKLNAQGRQMTQHCLTVLVLDPGNGVTPDGNGGYNPLEANELGCIYISSYMKFDPDRDKVTAPYRSWGAATDEAGLSVGHIGAWKYIEELPPTRAGNNGRRDRKFRLRAAEPTEAAIVEQCERLHKERKTNGTELPTGAPAPADLF